MRGVGSTIERVARKEFTEIVRDGRFRWAAYVILGLLVTALLIGRKHEGDIRQQHEHATSDARDHWLDQEAKNPHAAAHYGMFLFKPKMPLSFLDPGVDPYTGVSIFLEAHRQNEFEHRPIRDATTLQRFGSLTTAMVLQSLIPLLIVFLAFPAFAGEREQGTLRHLLSLGVHPAVIASGKALGIIMVLGVLLVPAMALSVVALASFGLGDLASSLPRFAALILVYLVYNLMFLAVALAVSALASSSRLALLSLLGFWTFNVLVAPRLVADSAGWILPTPTSREFADAIAQARKDGIDGHVPADRRLEALRREVLARYGVTSEEELPVSFAGIVLQAGEEYGDRVFDLHYERLWDLFRLQDMFSQAASVVAPLMAVRSLSMSLTGTDNAHHRAFAEAAERYRRMLVKTMNEDLIQNGGEQSLSYIADRTLWEKVPRFQYEIPGLITILRRQVLAILGLAVWSLASLGVVFVTTLRLRVE